MTGTGRGDLETRVLALERKIFQPVLASVQTRIAALEQQVWPIAPTGGGFPAVVTAVRVGTTDGGGVTAKSGTQAGTGNVLFSDVDPNSVTPGALATAETLAVFNWYSVAVPASTDVICGWAVNKATGAGCWVVLSRFCP